MLNFGWCISVVAVGVQNMLTKQIYGQTLFVKTTNIRGKSVSYVLDTTFKPCSVFLIYDNEVFAQWEIESDKKFDV